ncbi:MAG TPA: hypothetical protein VFT96_03730 [Gemmatimonadaceae bacterium]|nr:hypothetical protein [Gemmatimonadaceae bacterium]
MFVGHAAVAVLAGAARPRAPMLPLLLAAYGADAVEILLHGAQVEHASAMLWSHSLTALAVGGALSALVAWVISRKWDLAVLFAAVYASHGLCDLLTGERKPAWEDGPTYGLGLYQVPAADFVIEVALLLVAAGLLYRWRRPEKPRRMAVLVAMLVLLQLGFNLGDRSWLHGLKRDLMRATSAALAPRPASRVADPT